MNLARLLSRSKILLFSTDAVSDICEMLSVSILVDNGCIATLSLSHGEWLSRTEYGVLYDLDRKFSVSEILSRSKINLKSQKNVKRILPALRGTELAVEIVPLRA